MEEKKSLSPELLQQWSRELKQDTLAGVSAGMVSKAPISQVCFDTGRRGKMEHRFSLEIPTLPAGDQKATGRCWIFAGLNVLRESIAETLGVENLELSANFVSFYDHLEKANTFLEHVLATACKPMDDRFLSMRFANPVGDGGWWEYFVGLCLKYGAVPLDAMPETYQSSHTEEMNSLLNRQLRKDALELRSAVSEGFPEEQLRQKKKDMLARIYRFLTICLGTPPETFDFSYVDKERQYHVHRALTPEQFYRRYVSVGPETIVSILNAPCEEYPFYKTYVTQGEESILGEFRAKRLNLPMEEFEAAVLRQLQAGEPVWFVCDCDYSCAMEEGIWDPELFSLEAPFGLDFQMDKGQLLQTRQCSLNHAMVLTGVNLVDGKPEKWKIENSWGTQKGKNGYFAASENWFRQYVFTASIRRDFLTQEQLAQFRQEPEVTPLWSILG